MVRVMIRGRSLLALLKALQGEMFGPPIEVKSHPRRTKAGTVRVRAHHRTRTRPRSGRTHYASGSNHSGEIAGWASIKRAIGVAAPEINPAAEAELHRLSGQGIPVFLDSGAFSEVEMTEDGPRDVRPITPAAWDKRLGLAERLAGSLGRELAVVAPDKLFDQAATLARLEKYHDRLKAMADNGAEILVAIQPGEVDQATFYDQVADLLGFPFTPAIPMVDGATPIPALAAFLRHVQPDRLHLLGLGEQSKLYPAVDALLQRYAPDTAVSLDSNILRSKIGRNNGPGGGPRAMSAAYDAVTAAMTREAFDTGISPVDPGRGAVFVGDYTDWIGYPEAWTTPASRARIADEAMLSGDRRARWLEDPDAFASSDDGEGSPGYMDPFFSAALDDAWAAMQHDGATHERKRRQVRQVFDPQEIGPETDLVRLVSCGKDKSRTPKPARDLYEGSQARDAIDYAENQPAPFFILSAKHHLVHPDRELAHYEKELSTRPAENLPWGERVWDQLWERLEAGGWDGQRPITVEVHAGRRYLAALRDSPAKPPNVTITVPDWPDNGGVPGKGGRTGYRRQWYKQQREATQRDDEPRQASLL